MSQLSGLIVAQTVRAAAVFAALTVSTLLPASSARAADEPIFAPGDPIVTGFAGVLPPDAPPPDSDPLDYTFIDPTASRWSSSCCSRTARPKGKLIDAPAGVWRDRQGCRAGLRRRPRQCARNHRRRGAQYLSRGNVRPSASTSSCPMPTAIRCAAERARQTRPSCPDNGAARAATKAIRAASGRSTATTGEISLFTTIAANSGAGLGDIVFDAASQQFFVSDLDTGLIYRLGADGTILDTFDHGVTARPDPRPRAGRG